MCTDPTLISQSPARAEILHVVLSQIETEAGDPGRQAAFSETPWEQVSADFKAALLRWLQGEGASF